MRVGPAAIVPALIDTREEFDDLWALYLPIGVAVAAITATVPSAGAGEDRLSVTGARIPT